MKFFRRFQAKRRLARLGPITATPGTFTDGRTVVPVALTPEAARRIHDAAMYHGQYDIAALVEPSIPQGGKIMCTVADKAMMRRVCADALVV